MYIQFMMHGQKNIKSQDYIDFLQKRFVGSQMHTECYKGTV